MDFVVLTVVREAAQQIAGGIHALAGGRDVLLRHQALLIRGQHMQVGVAAVDVAAVFERQRRRFRRGIGHMVMLVEVTNRPAVGRYMPLKLPLIAQNVHQQRLRSAGRFAVDAVVRAHDAFHLRFLHRRLERGQIRLVHILRVRHSVEGMADGFRAGVHRKMLGARGDLEVLAIALQALDEPYAQPAGKIRIFTICLMTAAPARVTEDVDVRAPHGQALVNVAVAMRRLPVVFRARLGADDACHHFVEVLVENRRQANRLREHRRRARARHAVQGFIPPVIRRNAQPRNGRRVKTELGGLLLQRHLRNQLVCQSACFITIHHRNVSPFLFQGDTLCTFPPKSKNSC